MFHRRKEKGPATDVSIGILFVLFGWYYLTSAHAPDLCVGQGFDGGCLLGTRGFAGFFILLGLVFVVSGLNRAISRRREAS